MAFRKYLQKIISVRKYVPIQPAVIPYLGKQCMYVHWGFAMCWIV